MWVDKYLTVTVLFSTSTPLNSTCKASFRLPAKEFAKYAKGNLQGSPTNHLQGFSNNIGQRYRASHYQISEYFLANDNIDIREYSFIHCLLN